MNLKTNYDLGEKILRYGLAITVGWFGVSQLMEPSQWIGYLPGWAFTQSVISTTTLVYMNGVVEVLLPLLLIFNQYSRAIAFLLAVHMVTIIFHLGYDEIAVRDFGILVGFVALIFMSKNSSIISKYLKRKKE
jgi:uncharacterized membrane protein YphA (DoxX/SURF4 family)